MQLSACRLIALMTLLSVILAATQLFLKRFLGLFLSLPGPLVERVLLSARSPYLWATAATFLAGGSLWLWILPKARLSVAYPMISISYIAMLFLAYVFEREPISWHSVGGVALIVAGVILLAVGR